MKTNQEMVRFIDNLSVTQRTSDGYFDDNELLRQWNNMEENSRRQISRFLEASETKDFLIALSNDESQRAKMLIGENQLVIKVKGKNCKDGKRPDRVWMHPILFIKFAMWINPRFEVKVIRFVHDEMIRYRNEAGDAYRELSAAIAKIVAKENMPKAMQKIGEALNWIVFNLHEKQMRNKHGEEFKQRELCDLEKKVTDLINEGFITDYDNLIKYLRRLYQNKHFPKVFGSSSKELEQH